MITELDKNAALVLIDLQMGILNSTPAPVHPVNDIVSNAALLAAAFRKAKLPVVLVNVNPFTSPSMIVRSDQAGIPRDATARAELMKQKIASGYLELAPDLNAQPDDILITKETWSAFYNTALHAELKKRNVTGIVLGGISTSIGVEGTARTANEFGYNLTFVSDASTDRNLAAHEHSFKNIFPRIGEVGDTETIISKLVLRA